VDVQAWQRVTSSQMNSPVEYSARWVVVILNYSQDLYLFERINYGGWWVRIGVRLLGILQEMGFAAPVQIIHPLESSYRIFIILIS
jgi:hypothetical protein